MGKADPKQHGFDVSDGATSDAGPENSRIPYPKQAYSMAERGSPKEINGAVAVLEELDVNKDGKLDAKELAVRDQDGGDRGRQGGGRGGGGKGKGPAKS